MNNFLKFIRKIVFKVFSIIFSLIRKIFLKIGITLLFISESIIASKIYPYLEKNSYPIDKKLIKLIFKNKAKFAFLKLFSKKAGSVSSNSFKIQKKSTWNEFSFIPILITVNKRSQRTLSTIQKLNILNIKPHIFLGQTPTNLRDYLIESNSIMSPSRPVDLCCFVSHLLAIRDGLINYENDYFLIMEEDVVLFHDPKLVGLSNAMNNNDWEILQLEHCLPECVFRNKNYYESGIMLHRWMNPIDYGTGAYIIRRNFAESLINYFFDAKTNKINLNKCYQYQYPIVSDNIIYDLAKTLVFTFPLAHQNLNFPSLLGYSSGTLTSRFSAMTIVKKIWEDYS